MTIDLIAFIILIVAFFKGWRKGLILALFSFFAFFAGLAAAIKLSAVVANHLRNSTHVSERWLPALAFLIIFFLVVLLVRMGAKALESLVQGMMLGWVNRVGGVLLFAFLYLFIFSILLFYAQKLSLIQPKTIQESSTYWLIEPLGPAMINTLGHLLPIFKNLFLQLESFFSQMSGKTSLAPSTLKIHNDIISGICI